MQHFTPFSWITLSIFTGVLGGLGQILCKESGQAGMPPYVLIGIVGIVWASSSAIFMLSGSLPTKIGLPPLMSFAQAAALGGTVIFVVFVAGFIFWIENLSRFDAINKAPFITYVLMIVELAAGLSALVFDLVVMWYRGKLPTVSVYEVGGAALAIGSIVLFAMAPARLP